MKLRLLLLVLVASAIPVAITGCYNGDPEISITAKSDYGKIIEAVNNANKSLTEKLALIEAAMTRGFADNLQAQQLLQQALASLEGTLAQKLAAVEAAVKSQGTSLELKLGLIEAALANGFADQKTQYALIQSALESLGSALDEKLSAIESAVKSQTVSLETKLALIETTASEGLTDSAEEEELLRQAIGAITGSLSERLQAIETAIQSQTTSLSAKLGLLEAAVSEGLAKGGEALGLINKALESLGGTLEEKLAAIDTAIQGKTTALETKLSLIEAAVRSGFASDKAQRELLQKAVKALQGTAEAKLSAIKAAVESQGTTLSPKLDLIEEAVSQGLAGSKEKEELIAGALGTLDGTLTDKLSALETAMTHQTDSLTTRLELLQQALTTGLAGNNAAIDLLKTAVASLQGSADDMATALTAIDALLQEDGSISQALIKIVKAVRNADLNDVLLSITKILWQMTGSINGHEFVDMGGMFWATCNVGAKQPCDTGYFFAWGETAPKTDYSWNTYFDTNDNGKTFEKYAIGKKTVLEPQDDAACANWGGSWRTPTIEEWQWLKEHTQWEWKENYIRPGIHGFLLTSTVPGYESQRIFLPPCGSRKGEEAKSTSLGLYLSSSLMMNMSNWAMVADIYVAPSSIFFDVASGSSRCYGFPVRPVATK